MGVIRVIAPGMLTTVQDLGREGFGPMGVSASGAADAVSLRVGNRLVGNAEGAPGLEMTLLGGTFEFPDGALLALAGSDFGATLDRTPVALWETFEARAGQVLRLGPTRSGARCYLCLRGGIEAELFLRSASTHVLSGLGGLEGRALRKGDVLKIGTVGEKREKGTGKSACPTGKAGAVCERRLWPRGLKEMLVRKTLRVTAGPQSDWFSEAAKKIFYESPYRVAEESNRMGIRLEGAAIRMGTSGTNGEGTGKSAYSTGGTGGMVSEGVALGAVQVPESGMPIILFVEQQTTGGYPKIANVITADLHSLGQLRPRDETRFEQVDWETARSLLIEQEKLLKSEELLFE